VNLIRLKAPK